MSFLLAPEVSGTAARDLGGKGNLYVVGTRGIFEGLNLLLAGTIVKRNVHILHVMNAILLLESLESPDCSTILAKIARTRD
jgi:hypothetical protein